MMDIILINFLATVAYAVAGLMMVKLTKAYQKEIEEKVKIIDSRFIDDLYLKIPIQSDFQKMIVPWLLYAFWPISCIAAVLKLEWEYSRIKNHVFYKGNAR